MVVVLLLMIVGGIGLTQAASDPRQVTLRWLRLGGIIAVCLLAVVATFNAMVEKARVAPVGGAVEALEYAYSYYPSGTKHPTGSRLDLIVESARARCVREIIALLKSRAEEDLGDSPEDWIAGYPHR